nr:signal recognition particle subunit SRP72-like [Ipomoea batatas]
MAPKPKPKPSTAAAPAVSLEDLFTTLNLHIERSEYQQAVKVADQILAAAPGDEDAIHSCLNRMNVCLYRQNKLDEAPETLKGQEENSEKNAIGMSDFISSGKSISVC